VRRELLAKITTAVDDSIILVRDAMHDGGIREWQGNRIVDALLDARIAATEKKTARELAESEAIRA
jgi:hypothetical protein